MSEEVDNLVVKYGLDATGFQDGISNINRQMRVVQTEFKAAAAGVGDFGKSTDGLKLKADSLTQQIEIQRQKVSTLEGVFQRTADAKGRDAKETQNLEIKLNLARAALNKMESELGQTQDSLEKTRLEAIKSALQFDQLGERVSKAKGMFGEFFDKVKEGFGLAVGFQVFDTIKDGIKEALGAGIEFDSNMQQNSIAFTQMLHSAEGAKAMLGDLTKFAADTPFELPQVEDLAKKLLAFGFQAQQVKPMLTSIGDAASGLGLGAEGAERLTLAIGQMQAKGKVAGDEMLQLVEAGVPAWDILSKAMGVPTAQLQKMVSDGAVPADKAIQALLAGMEERFPHMMEAQSKSFAGLMSTLKDNFAQTMGTVMQPAFEWLSTKALPVITDLSGVFSTGFQKGGFLQGLIDVRTEADKTTGSNSILSKALWDLEAAFAFVTGKMSIFDEMLSDVGVPDSTIQTFDQFRQTAIDAFRMAGHTIKDVFGFIVDHAAEIKEDIIAIGAAIATFKTLSFISGIVDTFKELKKVMTEATTAQLLLNLVTEANPWVLIGTAVVGIGVLIYTHWSKISKFLIDCWNGIKEFAVQAWDAIKQFFVEWGPAILNVLTGGIAGLVITIVTHWQQIKEATISVWTSVTSFLSGIWTSIKNTVTTVWNGIVAYFSPQNNRLVQFFTLSWNAISSVFDAYLSVIKANLTAWWGIVTTIFTTAWESVKAVFSAGWEIIKTIFATAFLVIYDLVTGHWSDIGKVFAAAGEKIHGIVGDLWNKLTNLFTGAVTKIAGIISEWWQTIKTIFSNLGSDLNGYVAGMWDSLKSMWKSGIDAIATWVVNMVNNTLTFWHNLWTGTESAVRNGWDSVVSFFENAPSRIWSALTTMWASVTTWFDNLVKDVQQFGVHIVEGLWNGITSMATWIADKVGGWLKGLAQDARNALDIHSPSRVFAEIGGFIAEGLAVGIEEKAGQATAATQRLTDSIVELGKKSTDQLSAHMTVLKADMDVLTASMKSGKESSDQLSAKLANLTQQCAAQNEIVYRLHAQYLNLLNTKGAFAKETADAAQKYAQESKALTDLQTQISDTTKAMKEQAQALEDLGTKVQDVAKTYSDDLSKAQQDYSTQAAAINQKLIDDEKKLTDQYNQELQSRTDSLRNFVGLFDAVQPKRVSGQVLLNNLQSQVTAFEDWQKNMKSLASRNGIDQDLVSQLQSMGPQAGAQIAALNSLTDDQLSKYVSLWKQKNADAKSEATDELTGLKNDTQKQIAALQAQTATQLDQLRQQWQQKNADIRQNTLNTLQQMVQDAQKNGMAFVDKLAESISGALPDLMAALGGISDVMSNPLVAIASETPSTAPQGAKKGTTGAAQTVDTTAKVLTSQQDTIKKMVAVWQDGRKQLAAIWDAITKDAQVKMQAATDLIKADWNGISDYFAKIDLKPTGEHIMQGLIDGMQAMEPAVISMARSIADTIRTTIQSALDIHSPSRVTAELGGYVGAGLVVGMDGSLADLKRAADRMARAALPSLDQVSNFGQPAASTAGTMRGGDTYHFKIEEGAFQINPKDLKDIQSISEFVTRLPQVARAMGIKRN